MAFQEKVALALALDYIDKRAFSLSETCGGSVSEKELDNEFQSEFMAREMVAIHDHLNQALVLSKPSSGCGAYLNSLNITLTFIRKELINHTLRHVKNREEQKTKKTKTRRR